jgi:GR25 family glycosyltransferase involved in LPS biosynthesis
MGVINEFFDAIYCINLDERTDRWEQAQVEFKKLGVEGVKRFSAIRHERGAIGCRESHLGIIKEAKELGLNNVLIFEDDVLVLEGGISKIGDSLNELKNIPWELFYFGATVDPNVGKLTPVSPHLVKTNFAYTTHAYAINGDMFDFILEQGPYHGIIDVFYNQKIVSRGNSHIINPMLCIQQESYSDIEGHYADYGWMVDFFNKSLK